MKKQLEGKCIREGFVLPGSVEIVSRSAGTAQLSHFNANFIFHIQYSAKICNPVEGDIVEAEITNVNKMGILARAGEGDPPPLSILRQNNTMNNDKFEKCVRVTIFALRLLENVLTVEKTKFQLLVSWKIKINKLIILE